MYLKQICSAILFCSIFIFSSCQKDQETSEILNFATQSDASNSPENRDNNNRQRTPNPEIATEWMNLFIELDRYATGMRPNASARAIAYISLAAYETVVPSMRGLSSNNRKISGLDIKNHNQGRTDWLIALNQAYATSLDHFLINLLDVHRNRIAELRSKLSSELNVNKTKRQIEDSEEYGNYIANQIIEFSQSDLEAENQIINPQPLSYTPPTGLGYWTFSAEPERALFPYWSKVRSFTISPNQTSSVPPLAYSTSEDSEYYQQMLEAMESNNKAKLEDNEQLWIAEFWSDDVENITFSPPTRQISIANQLIPLLDLNLHDALHLYLKVGLALNDAAVATWKYKYEYMVMRPSVYIQDHIDAGFQTNLYRLIPWPNPTFPGYPSGHSCFASAAAGVFIDFFGNSIDFTDRSHEGRTEFRSTPRQFSTFKEMAEENGYARIPLGVHVRMECEEGLRLGYEISDAVNAYDLKSQPTP